MFYNFDLYFRATDDFNNGVVLTNRPLKLGEKFEVRLEKVVKKWAGSIEIGVTTHTPTDLEFPITMTYMRYVMVSHIILKSCFVN